MTKQESVIILAMLSAYYGDSKADAEQMAAAWYVVLQQYDFATAQIAVVNFAKNDYREYAVFPSVGKIVEAIEGEYAKRRGILNAAINKKTYDVLPETYHEIVSQGEYNKLVSLGEAYLQAHRVDIVTGLLPHAMKELEDAYGRK